MGVLEFDFQNYDFTNQAEDHKLTLRTKQGWEICTVQLAHPYLMVLWQRPKDGEDKGQPQADLAQELHDVQAELDHLSEEFNELRGHFSQAQEDIKTLVVERDQAREVARQLKARVDAQEPST